MPSAATNGADDHVVHVYGNAVQHASNGHGKSGRTFPVAGGISWNSAFVNRRTGGFRDGVEWRRLRPGCEENADCVYNCLLRPNSAFRVDLRKFDRPGLPYSAFRGLAGISLPPEFVTFQRQGQLRAPSRGRVDRSSTRPSCSCHGCRPAFRRRNLARGEQWRPRHRASPRPSGGTWCLASLAAPAARGPVPRCRGRGRCIRLAGPGGRGNRLRLHGGRGAEGAHCRFGNGSPDRRRAAARAVLVALEVRNGRRRVRRSGTGRPGISLTCNVRPDRRPGDLHLAGPARLGGGPACAGAGKGNRRNRPGHCHGAAPRPDRARSECEPGCQAAKAGSPCPYRMAARSPQPAAVAAVGLESEAVPGLDISAGSGTAVGARPHPFPAAAGTVSGIAAVRYRKGPLTSPPVPPLPPLLRYRFRRPDGEVHLPRFRPAPAAGRAASPGPPPDPGRRRRPWPSPRARTGKAATALLAGKSRCLSPSRVDTPPTPS